MLRIITLITLFFSTTISARATFEKGTRELGVSNLGIGYSNNQGLQVSANARYQYFILSRVGLGGMAYYNNFNDHEWMGIGPSASYVLFTTRSFFARYDQQLIAAKFSGFTEAPASLYGSSAFSLNYLPEDSRTYLGAGYAVNYALSDGKVLNPNYLQVFIGWLF
jgi:hypothetical protein